MVSFVQELPAPILDDVAVPKPVEQPKLSGEPPDSLEAMKIAWRYQNLPKVQVIARPLLIRDEIYAGLKHSAGYGELFDPFLINPAGVSVNNGM